MNENINNIRNNIFNMINNEQNDDVNAVNINNDSIEAEKEIQFENELNANVEEENSFNRQLVINENNDNLILNNNEKINKSEDEYEEEEINEKEDINKKCSLEDHKDENAVMCCQECQINMCKRCENIHSKLFKNHHLYSLDKDKSEIFTGLCTHKKHSLELEFYCQTHNKLCCAACISKIKIKGKGQHKDCEVCYIKKIKNIKKQYLDKNLKNLKELSNKLEPSIKELKSIYEKINDRKEKLKIDVQKKFTKLKCEINNREDKLLEEIDKKYNELFFKEELIRESEKLPNLVKLSLEKVKMNENDWNDDNLLPKLINESINIENAIININNVYEKIKKFNSNEEYLVEFEPKNNESKKDLLEGIKNYGNLKVIKPKKLNIENKIRNNFNELDKANYMNNMNININMDMNNNIAKKENKNQIMTQNKKIKK